MVQGVAQMIEEPRGDAKDATGGVRGAAEGGRVWRTGKGDKKKKINKNNNNNNNNNNNKY